MLAWPMEWHDLKLLWIPFLKFLPLLGVLWATRRHWANTDILFGVHTQCEGIIMKRWRPALWLKERSDPEVTCDLMLLEAVPFGTPMAKSWYWTSTGIISGIHVTEGVEWLRSNPWSFIVRDCSNVRTPMATSWHWASIGIIFHVHTAVWRHHH